MAPLGAKGVGEPPTHLVDPGRRRRHPRCASARTCTRVPVRPQRHRASEPLCSGVAAISSCFAPSSVRLELRHVSNEREIMTWEIFGDGIPRASPRWWPTTTSPT